MTDEAMSPLRRRMRPVQEVPPIAQSRLRVLVDRHDDCLDVVITPTLTTSPVPDFSERCDPRRIVLGIGHL